MADLVIEPNYRCNSCGFMDPNKYAVSNHIKAEHRDGRGKVFGKVLAPKMPAWARLRKIKKACEHVRITLAGDADKITCIECGESSLLRGQLNSIGESIEPEKVIDDFTRKHFYKHELVNKFC